MTARPPEVPPTKGSPEVPPAGRQLEILAPGPLTTLQDLGRPGWAHLGVTASGAADTRSLTLANRLLGNPENTAALELTLGGVRARIHSRRPDAAPAVLHLALTGASCPVRLDGRAIGMNAPVAARDGQLLDIGAPTSGLRTYLAVRGGFDVPPVLGSRATDLLSGLGPPPLTAGDLLPVAPATGALPGVDLAPCAAPPAAFTLRVVPGPREEWFDAASRQALYRAAWTATSRSNRVGVRLEGPALVRSGSGELPAEGMVRGALQVPPNGQPILFLADHPVTGGYPVIGVVHADDLPLAGQLPPGAPLRFRRYAAVRAPR
ncbi:biotin-dependent carboxyltransferase family protein [Streptomyces sp. NPDC093085]|uniref:5-oxoprolinase subunit C family protein n=1 Tax=Streptomyces sp. NPDC093085 TaxID=3155068 RepID=UPI00342BEB19